MAAADDAIIIIDHYGLIQRFNHAAEGIFGYSEDYLVGKNVSLLMPDPHRGQHDQYIARYRETGNAAVIGIGREVDGLKKDLCIISHHLQILETALLEKQLVESLKD